MADSSPGADTRFEAVAVESLYRRRIALFLIAACSGIGLLGASLWTATAIRRVDVVEAERDRWQRPRDVVNALELEGDGQVVADLGSGVGYFALKLADAVGARGRVLAVDVRRFPLAFLWVRALLRARRNVEVVHAEPEDPHLPPGSVDAILVANTFHEFEEGVSILSRAREALRPGGRLVVVDPGPDLAEVVTPGGSAHRHVSSDSSEDRLRRAGFEIVYRDDRFINGSDHGSWWLIVARRP